MDQPAKHPSIDPEQLERRVPALIRKSTRGGLSIYNYTEECQYGRMWDKYTCMSRGLILDADGRVVAKPFPKFFNLGEPSCPALPNEPYDVFEKVDGSLGIWYFFEDRWRVATRGSLENDYTVYAEQFAPLLTDMPKHWTVMTEICMPADLDGMARAVKHESGIHILGAVNRLSFDDIDPRIAREYWPGKLGAKWEGNEPIDHFLNRAKHEEGTEGWVVRFQSGLRVKIKTTWYLHIFRAISDLTEKHIRELMIHAGLDEWLKDFPEELQEEAKSIYDGIQTRFVARREVIMRDFARINAEATSMLRDFRENRKAFALAVKDHPEKSFLFTLYDGQNIDRRLLEEC